MLILSKPRTQARVQGFLERPAGLARLGFQLGHYVFMVAQKVHGAWGRGRLARMVRRCVRRADKMSAYPGENATTF